MAESKTKWYSLRVISGKERKIKERIDLEIDRSGWRSFLPSVIVPTEKVYKIRNGKNDTFIISYSEQMLEVPFLWFLTFLLNKF